jgi:GNAT superfamily N-acetyltransferase
MEIRPMREDDVQALAELVLAADQDLSRRRGEPVRERPITPVILGRFRFPLETDPDGAWVAEDDQGLAGGAYAFLRDGVWILSQLAVRPGLQSAGLGTRLLRRAWDYGAQATGRLIATSQDPRAIRAYSRLGLDTHPAFRAQGTPQGVSAPDGIREGDLTDLPFTEAVDRHVRAAAHGPDIALMLETGETLLIAEQRGYAVITENGSVRLLAAYAEDGARDLLRAVLARAGEREIGVSWLTGRQQWAIEVCLEARLELRLDSGALMLGGDVGPFHPYLPSGPYL